MCPSAPVLKINHDTGRQAHDFNMSSETEKKKDATLPNTFLFYSNVFFCYCHATGVNLMQYIRTLLHRGDRRGSVCICAACLLLCDVMEGGRGWQHRWSDGVQAVGL